jgi:hypothetical protein
MTDPRLAAFLANGGSIQVIPKGQKSTEDTNFRKSQKKKKGRGIGITIIGHEAMNRRKT